MPIFIEQLTSKTNEIFKTVLAIAKRAGELSSGRPPVVKVGKNVRSTTVAMKEFGEGKVTFEKETEK